LIARQSRRVGIASLFAFNSLARNVAEQGEFRVNLQYGAGSLVAEVRQWMQGVVPACASRWSAATFKPTLRRPVALIFFGRRASPLVSPSSRGLPP
jgi:hypothetical protein